MVASKVVAKAQPTLLRRLLAFLLRYVGLPLFCFFLIYYLNARARSVRERRRRLMTLEPPLEPSLPHVQTSLAGFGIDKKRRIFCSSNNVRQI